jgi:hypothetical protein
MSNKLINAGSNQRRSFVPMVVLTASGFVSWRHFVFNPASNRFKNRRAAPAGSYSPIVVKRMNPVSELKKIRPVLNNCILSECIVIKEKNKPWYHFFLSGGII